VGDGVGATVGIGVGVGCSPLYIFDRGIIKIGARAGAPSGH
jgi:hypothetical protein